jgi:hypothetical protein
VQALILAQDPSLAGRVYLGRVTPIKTLPAVNITSGADQSQEPGPVQHRRLELVVEIHCKVADGLDDALDAVALTVESALGADPKLGGLVKWIHPEESTPQMENELEKPAGVLRQSWAVLYRVDTRAPDAPVP